MSYYRYTGFYKVFREESGRLVSAYVSIFVWLFANFALDAPPTVTERRLLYLIDEAIDRHIEKQEHP